MKKIVCTLFALILVLALAPNVALANNNITVTVNGQAVVFADQGPVIVNGRTLVPVAGVFQALGFNTQWNPNTRQVTITRDSDTIILSIGSRTFTTNSVSHTLDVPAQIIGDRTMLPIAIVLRSVGYDVEWNDVTRTVAIIPPLSPPGEFANPFASALSGFFANVTQAPDWAVVPEAIHAMSASTHAILVDVDGNGTQGMLASKWTTDVQRYLPASSASSTFVQRVFLLVNNQTRQVALDNMAVSSAGRLITISGVDGQGISMRAYTLLGLNNGQLTPIKSIAITRYGHWEYHGVESWVSTGEADSYFVNYHTNEFWNRDAAQDQAITYAEFNQLLTRYGLHDTSYLVWELPDETNAILSMTTN